MDQCNLASLMKINRSLVSINIKGLLWGSSLHRLQPHLPASTSRKRCKPPSGVQSNDPYKVLQVAPGSSLVDIKAAYYQKIKLLHPDVNENDTTEQAVVLNAAYATLLQDYSRENGGELQGQPDVFDLPETEATELFVNPFLCYNANPLQWAEIQEVARNAEKEGRDPEEVLRWVRAGPSESAVIYLTPLQLEAVVEELKSIGPAADVITLEACAFYLTDCLYRARVANNRAPLKPR
ncbi:hypothetical protein Ndes2437A_g07394 [Nannochloris sp. 'desiccata']